MKFFNIFVYSLLISLCFHFITSKTTEFSKLTKTETNSELDLKSNLFIIKNEY